MKLVQIPLPSFFLTITYGRVHVKLKIESFGNAYQGRKDGLSLSGISWSYLVHFPASALTNCP